MKQSCKIHGFIISYVMTRRVYFICSNMISANSTGYGWQQGRFESLCFSGEESKYEHWEIKFLAHIKLRKLKDERQGLSNRKS